MASRTTALFTTVRSEGGLLPADLLQRIAARDGVEGLTPAHYHLDAGVSLKEAISRSWSRLVPLWRAFSAAREQHAPDEPLTGLTREKWLLPLFDELGFGRLQSARTVASAVRSIPVSHAFGAVPLHLVGFNVDLDERTRGVQGAARSSPHGLVQELLNSSDECLWGIVSNGRRLRLLRDSAALTRQAFVEFDLEALFAGEQFADFALLWLLVHQSRFETGAAGTPCQLEHWQDSLREQGTRAREALRSGVERAIESLGQGFIAFPGNAALRERLRSGALTKEDLYRQLLRTVYRLLFLFVAEDRDLLHPDGTAQDVRARFRSHYGTARLREMARKLRGSRHGDLWLGLRHVMQTLEATGSLHLGLPALGSFLWSSAAAPDLAAAGIANRDLLQALHRLAWHQDGKLLRAVDYKNLGSEELGSIYESLLELHPEMHIEAREFRLSSAAGHERKTTGSYYTPPSLVAALLDSALEPVLEQACRKAARADREAAILDLKVVDPACGSGHFLIAAAHRIARRLAMVRSGEDEPSPREVRKALRDVIGRSLYGVDLNSMALELAKVSLWLEALEPGKPLSFLDHHFQHGNALLGVPLPERVVAAASTRAERRELLDRELRQLTSRLNATGLGAEEAPELEDRIRDLKAEAKALASQPSPAAIPDEAFDPLEGDEKTVAREWKKQNKLERIAGQGTLGFASMAADAPNLAADAAALEAMEDGTLAQVRAKEAHHLRATGSPRYCHEKLVADAWCAAFVQRKDATAPPALTDGVFQRLRQEPASLDPRTAREVARLAREFAFFHWHLAFPEVFAKGGFDVVLGNPPWERIKLQEQEWFAERRPEIAEAPNKAARGKMIEALGDTEEGKVLLAGFKAAQRHAEGESVLVRETARFPLTGRGDVNTYSLFAESMRALLNGHGRVGCIVPSGIATDDTTKWFFGDLTSKGSLASLHDFENREGLFQGIDRRIKFALLTLSGRNAPCMQAEFAFFLQSTSDLEVPERRFTLSAADIALINPNTKTCPVFRTRRDAEITKAIYRRVPVLLREGPPEENPWGVRFLRLLDMSNDSGAFRTRQQLESEGFALDGNIFRKGGEVRLPLYEAKMVHHYDHRYGSYADRAEGSENTSLPDVPLARLQDPAFTPLPRYWVPAREVDKRLANRWSRGWLLGWRDITNSTNERTVIASVIPRVGVGHKLPLFFAVGRSAIETACFLAALASFALDYFARQKIGGTSLTYFYLKQLPILPPAIYGQTCPWSVGETIGAWILPRVLELTYTAHDLAPFARDLGFEGPPFPFNSERRFQLRCELDAAFFHLYGLSAADTSYILDTFPIVRSHDESTHGTFRTKTTILTEYARLRQSMASPA